MDELISEFIAEATENLAELDSELVKLERNASDPVILGNIFRMMHTIKGTCGFLGLPRLESLAHAGEDVLGKIRDKELEATPQAISLILSALDTIRGLIGHISEKGEEGPGDDSELIEQLKGFANSKKARAAPPEPPKSEPARKAKAPPAKKEKAPENSSPEAAPPQTAAPKVAPKEQAAEAAPDAKDPAGSAQSIRVNIDTLETLMQMVSELVLTRNQLMQIVRAKDDNDFATPLQQLSTITTELQEGIMKTRMQPIGNAWSKFPRLVRDLSLELGKKIEMKTFGAETELDRQLLEAIKDPLTHMLRNACDHGLETPAERIAAGKPETGTVTLRAYHEGGHIIIEIQDDGRGINIDKIRAKALASGLATPAALEAMSEKEIARFIFHPGFSTADTVTSVSGRGVGMDVVKHNLEKIGGAIDLNFVRGKGSLLSIKIPLTLAIVSVLLVESRDQKFAIPQTNVLELVSVAPGSGLDVETINNALVLRLRNRLLPVAALSSLLGTSASTETHPGQNMYMAVCHAAGRQFGILVDRVYDIEEIVVKPVPRLLGHVPFYSGTTILGDGGIIMILDPNNIARTIIRADAELGGQPEAAPTPQAKEEAPAIIGFLLFRAGKGAPKAVPLEMVLRLEEIDVGQIEAAGDQPVIQYRGELMQLISIDREVRLPLKGMIDIIVLNYDKKLFGLVVDEIIDIAYSDFAIRVASGKTKNGFLGSMLISGKSTDVLDVGFFLPTMSETGISESRAAACRVLLVEDSPFFRGLTVPFLSSAGYSVTTAENAQQALEILQDNHFDMIVTDIEMPGMDGLAFAELCRNSPVTSHIPIIAYTVAMNDDLIRRSRSIGINDCIAKTDRAGLLESVSHWLSIDTQVRH